MHRDRTCLNEKGVILWAFAFVRPGVENTVFFQWFSHAPARRRR
jgi:hypothetical protein